MFELNDKQKTMLKSQIISWDERICEIQKNQMSHDDFMVKTYGGKFPYYGAIGGGLKYSFTPTGIGTIVEVTNTMLNETVNLTDYDEW